MKKLAASLAVVGALMFGAVELVWADTTSWDDQSGAKQLPEYFGTIFDVSEKEGWVFEVLYNHKNSEPEVRLGLYNEETKQIYLYRCRVQSSNKFSCEHPKARNARWWKFRIDIKNGEAAFFHTAPKDNNCPCAQRQTKSLLYGKNLQSAITQLQTSNKLSYASLGQRYLNKLAAFERKTEILAELEKTATSTANKSTTSSGKTVYCLHENGNIFKAAIGKQCSHHHSEEITKAEYERLWRKKNVTASKSTTSIRYCERKDGVVYETKLHVCPRSHTQITKAKYDRLKNKKIVTKTHYCERKDGVVYETRLHVCPRSHTQITKAKYDRLKNRKEEEARKLAEVERKRTEEERRLAEQKIIVAQEAGKLIPEIEAFAKTSPRQIDFLLLLELFHKAKPVTEGAWSEDLRDDYLALRKLVINHPEFVVFQKVAAEERRIRTVALQTEVRRAAAFLKHFVVENFSSPSAPLALSVIGSLEEVLSSEDPETLQAAAANFSSFIDGESLQVQLSHWESEFGDSIVAEADEEAPTKQVAEVVESQDIPADTASQTASEVAKNPDAVAVVIGNKSYVGAIPEVSFAHNDADAVKRYLINTLGYREGNVIDVRDTTKGELEAIFGNEKSYRGRLFNYIRANESDVTVFYSGHGVPDTKSRRGYLLPVDADPDIIDITGYPLDVMLENLSKMPARSMSIFLDACFSGDSPKGMIIRATSGISVTAKIPQTDAKMVVITASQGDQYASWDEDAEHGLFTKHLLEALTGTADTERYGNGDGEITVGEVKNYLDHEMTYQARRRFSREQVATVSGDVDSVLVTYLSGLTN